METINANLKDDNFFNVPIVYMELGDKIRFAIWTSGVKNSKYLVSINLVHKVRALNKYRQGNQKIELLISC